MEIARTIADARAAVGAARARRHTVGLIPTMGALHAGHLSLVDHARARCATVVMSIFVNPLQFGPAEGLALYPRDEAGDTAVAAARGVDIVFAPTAEEMYGAKRHITVDPGALAARWEGEARPGHFAGVLTVVAKLFHIVQPDIAVFGQKDVQQATLVRAMVRELDFPLRVDIGPTVREADGLALSSRNTFLSTDDRTRALALSRALREVQRRYATGETRADPLQRAGRAMLEDVDGIRVDYLALVDPVTLEPAAVAAADTLAIVAARVGPTRLIDNVALGGL